MEEVERKNIVDRIKHDIEEYELLKEKKRELELIELDPIIIEYLRRIEEIAKLEEKQKQFGGSLERMITSEFILAFDSTKSNEAIKSCKHEIWIYEGSYGLSLKYYTDIRSNRETCDLFEYNRYVCLECGKSINVANWEAFEKENFVLKNRYDLNVHIYRNIYFKLLYENTAEDARKKIIDEFNKKKEECEKIKTKKF